MGTVRSFEYAVLLALGFSLAAIHAFFSFCVINPAYFPKYFLEDGRLNLMGEMGLATGVIGLWALTMPALTTLPMMPKAIGGVRWKRSQRMGYLCLTLIVVHLVFLGWKGWLTPGRWTAGLPPISLLAVLAALVPLIARQRAVSAAKNKD